MRALAVAFSFFLVLVFVAPLLRAQQPTETELVHAVEALGYADGSVSYRYLTYDRQTGQFTPAAAEDRPSRGSQMLPPNFRFQPALVQQSSKWGNSNPKPWSWAEQAPPNNRLLAQNRPRIRAVKNLVFVRRGNLNMPRFTLSNQKIPVRNLQNPVLDVQQFDFDKRSTVIRTANNKFFRGVRPDVTSRVIRFESANCTLAGGTFRCPFLINECDIYLRSRTATELGFFEDGTVLNQRIALASHYKFCYGHNSNVWGHDLSGNLNREVGPVAFNNNNNRTWKQERKEDDALYSVAGVAALSPPLPARFILPDRESVIDLGFLKVPILDPLMSVKQNAFQFDAFFATNLKGFSSGKNLRFWVYEGNSTLPKDLIIGPIGGSSIDRRSGTLLGKPSFARYWLSYVSLGRKVHWDRLKARLEQPKNMGKSVRGRPYDYVMQITVVVSGFLTENGPRQKATQVLRLVYTEGEERDPIVDAVAF